MKKLQRLCAALVAVVMLSTNLLNPSLFRVSAQKQEAHKTAVPTEVAVGDLVVGVYGNDNYDIKSLDVLKPYGLVGMNGPVGTNNKGIMSLSTDNALIFKVAENSPFWFEAQFVGSGKVELYASPSGEDGSWVAKEYAQTGAANGNGQYYTEAIGEGNKYVKLVLNGAPWDNMVRLFKVAFDREYASMEVPVGDLVVGAYGNDNYDIKSLDVLKPYGLVGMNGPVGTNNGLIMSLSTDNALIFKVADNASFWFEATAAGSGKVELYASPSGEDGTWVAKEYIQTAETAVNTKEYFAEAIGEGNKYVKLVLNGAPWDNMVYLRKVRFDYAGNAVAADSSGGDSSGDSSGGSSSGSGDTSSGGSSSDTESKPVVLPTIDTKLDFVNGYTAAVSKAYKCSYDLGQVYQGGVSGQNTPNTYVIYKVDKNSPIIATVKLFSDSTEGRPEFYASADAKNWTKLEMQTDREIKGLLTLNYVSDGIGAENKYIKVVISNVALGENIWYVDLQQLAFNASTEAEDVPKPDTTLDFIANGKADLDRVFRQWNFDIAPAAGYENAAYATKAKNNYIVINTADNSPFAMSMRVHDSKLAGTVTLLVSDDPNSTSWTPLDVTRVQPQEGGYNAWTYYATAIGEGKTYVKIILSESSPWAFCIENISYSAGAHIGPDDSGYVEPEPDDGLPKVDTTLDFVNQYNASLNEAYMFSPDLCQIW